MLPLPTKIRHISNNISHLTLRLLYAIIKEKHGTAVSRKDVETMSDYLQVSVDAEFFTVSFDVGDENIMELGERITTACPDAYMNGYGWDVLLRSYMAHYAPNLLRGLETDPEAGMFAAYYENVPENEEKAQALAELIQDLTEQESDIFDFLEEFGDEVEWEESEDYGGSGDSDDWEEET